MANLPKPVHFQTRPMIKGLNVSVPPTLIDKAQSLDNMNVRFKKGQAIFRDGFKIKYRGMREPALWIDVAYTETGDALVAFSNRRIYASTDQETMQEVTVYDGAGGTLDPPLSITYGSSILSIDVGYGAYDFNDIDGGVFWGQTNLADILVYADSAESGIFLLVYGGSGVEAEKITATDAPGGARGVAIFAGRLFACGLPNNKTEIRWSAVNRFDHWGSGYSDAGSLYLSDAPDWIQSAQKLGDYLIVYKERSIYVGRETYLPDPAVRFEPAPGQGIGLAAPNSIGDLGEEHIFLGWDDVYVFSLQRIQAVGSRIKDELFYGEDGIIPDYISSCTGIIAEEFDEYWLFVPSGKWPSAGGSGVSNELTDPTFEDGMSSWVTWNDATDFDVSSGTTNAVLGNNAIAVTLTTGTHVGIYQTNNFNESLLGREYSVVAFVKSDGGGTCLLRLQLMDSEGSNTVIESRYAELADGEYTRLVLSHKVSDADTEQIRVWVRNLEEGTTLYVDAVQLVRVDNVSSLYIDESSGYKDLAYIGPEGTPVAIPFVIDQVGPWFADTCWVYNYDANAWSKWRLPMSGFGYDVLFGTTTIASLSGTIAEQDWRFDEKLSSAFAPSNLLGNVDGQIYESSERYTRDYEGVYTRDFAGYWVSKDFDLGQPMVDKTYSRLVLYHEASHIPLDVTVSVSTDQGASWIDVPIQIQSGGVQTFVDFFQTGPQARFRIRAESPGFTLNGFGLKVVPRGESQPY